MTSLFDSDGEGVRCKIRNDEFMFGHYPQSHFSFIL